MKIKTLGKIWLGVIAVITDIDGTRQEALSVGRDWIEDSLGHGRDHWSRVVKEVDEDLGRLATVGIASVYAGIILLGHKLIRDKREV